MPEAPDKGGRVLLLVTGVMVVLFGGGLWLSRESGREQARYDAERAAVDELFPRLSAEIEQRAQRERKELILHDGIRHGDDRSHREWSVSLSDVKYVRLLNVRIRLDIDGRLRKRNAGIRVETSGLPYDRAFVDRLSEELRLRGLAISSTSP